MDKSNKKGQADISAIDDEEIATIKKKIINREITVNEAIKKYKIHPKQIYSDYPKQTPEKSSNDQSVFTKEQEKALKEHIIKCSKVQYNLTISTMRSMTYEYAVKLPGCKYPKKWDDQKMATMEWFKRFRARHSDLRNITTKNKNSCICIMGCHMGPEGKTKLKKLEARVLIARVYHYLHKEYEYMKMSNDLSLLLNILRRTAEATGVCEQTITSILDEEQKIQHSLDEDMTPAPDVRVKKKRKKNEDVMSEHDYTKANNDNSGESSKMDATNADSNTESNGTTCSVVNSDLESNMDATNKDANIYKDGVVSTEFDSNVNQTVEDLRVEDSTPTNDNSDNMLYSNIESNVNSIVEVTNTENVSTNVTYSDFDSNMDTVVEVSDSESDEMCYSAVYSDFERLQQGASLIKSIQVEILEDDDEQNVKAESEETTMDGALEVDTNKQNEKRDAEPTMEAALVEVEKNEQQDDSNAEMGTMTMEIVPVQDTNQKAKSDPDVDTMTVEIIPVELCKQAVTANGAMKVSLFTVEPKTVPHAEEREKSEEEEESKNLEESKNVEDDNNDDDNTFDIQRDPRSLLRSTRSLFYSSKYYSNKLKKVGTPINRLNDNYL